MKSLLEIAFVTMFVLLLVFGIIFVIVCFVKSNEDSFDYLVTGLSCIVSSFFAIGFNYIVQAACTYLDRCKEDEYENSLRNQEE